MAITFVGFSTIFATFRQGLGGTISKYDILPSLVGRGASAMTAVLLVVFNATYPRRRRIATGTAMPKQVWVELSLIYIAAGVLLANALGTPIRSGVAPHALGLTILLFATFLAFLFGLDLLPRQPARPIGDEVERRGRTPGGGGA